jgi:hypothetical protein
VSQIDLNNPPPNHNYKVAVERDESDGERRVRLTKDLALFFSALAIVGIVVWLATTTVLSPQASAEDRKWAMSILTAVAGGLVGYLVRK